MHALLPHTVDVWFVDLADSRWCAAAAATMDAGERSRAARFHFDRDGRRFPAARAALRSILASHIGCDPASLTFETNTFSKPRLAPCPRDVPWQFNVSHAGDVAAIALSTGAAVGIDLERIRELADLEGIAARYFTPAERVFVCGARGTGRARGFYRCWTRKEACVKACGEGLSIPLDSFDVQPASPAPLTLVLDCGAGTLSLTLWDLETPDSFEAAVAVEGSVRRLASAWWRPDALATW